MGRICGRTFHSMSFFSLKAGVEVCLGRLCVGMFVHILRPHILSSSLSHNSKRGLAFTYCKYYWNPSNNITTLYEPHERSQTFHWQIFTRFAKLEKVDEITSKNNFEYFFFYISSWLSIRWNVCLLIRKKRRSSRRFLIII